MKKPLNTPGNSTEEQKLLRPIAAWAADYAEQALPIFENRHPDDTCPREAIEAGRAFGQGKRRDQNLRRLALAAFKIGKEVDEPSKCVARAASLVAALAYTHTDLQTGLQGIRQAKHILGPIVYAALALEVAAGDDTSIGDEFIYHAAKSAPPEVHHLLEYMPPQPREKNDRLNVLFANLDLALR